MASKDSSGSSTHSLMGLAASGGALAEGDTVDLTCPVCYDTYRSPRFLPCHHTLCTECIGDLMERARADDGRDCFQCPLCQVSVPVPDDGVTSFQVNFYLAPFLSGRWSSESGAPQPKDMVRRQLLSLTTLQGALADLEDECRHRVTALEDSCRLVVQTVDSTRQQACSVISARADKSAEKVRGLKGRIGKVVEGEMKNIQEKRNALQSLLTSASDAMAAGDAEFLRQKTKLMARIQSVMSRVPPSRGHLQFSFKMSPAIQSLIAKDSAFGYMTVQFQSPVLRHKLMLSSTKQQRKLRKLCPWRDGSVLASVGNCLVTITADLTEAKRLEFPGEIVDFTPARDGFVYVVLPFPNAVKRLNTNTDVAGDFVSPLSPPAALACTDKRELVFTSHDGKELSLTFYSDSGARLKRVTLPRPEFSPVSMFISKQGRIYLGSATEILCLDSDFSEVASCGETGGLRPRCLSGLRGMGSGVGEVLVANAAAGNVEIVELSGNKLSRKEEIIQWKRGTTDEDADLSRGLLPKISCAMLDQSGKLWVGQEDGHVAVYDWLLRTT